MNFSKKARNSSLSAIFLATALLALYSAGGEKLRSSMSDSLVQGAPGGIVLADGGAPNPMPPPPPTK